MSQSRPGWLAVERFKQDINKTASASAFYQLLKQEDGLALSAIRYLSASHMPHPVQMDSVAAKTLGRHMLAEFKLRPSAFVDVMKDAHEPELIFQTILLGAAKAAKATILKSAAFRDEKTGNVCCVVVIEESHFSLHYLPHADLVAIDAYTCGEIDFEKAVDFIQSALSVEPYDQIEFRRGIRTADDERFVYGIAELNVAQQLTFFKVQNAQQSLGQHRVAEFYFCNPSRINAGDFVEEIFNKAVKKAGGDVHFSYVHQFQPQGVSAVVLAKGLHLTIHDWPEYDYASIDLCVFDPAISVKKIMDYLEGAFQPQKITYDQFPRGATQHGLLQPALQYLGSSAPQDKLLKV